MSFQLQAWASRQTTGSPTRKAVLLALANAANHHSGQCNPSIELIGIETELGSTAVKRALKDLVEQGLITRERNRRQDGSLGTYSYRFPETARGVQPETPGVPGPGTRGVPQEEQGSSEPGTTAEAVVARSPDPPKLVLINGQNLAFNALAEVCAVDPGGGRGKTLAAALNGPAGIRAQAWREMQEGRVGPRCAPGDGWERLLSGLVYQRAEQYRKKMPAGTILTPSALAKWWSDLPAMDCGKLSPQDVFEVAQAELDRVRGSS